MTAMPKPDPTDIELTRLCMERDRFARLAGVEVVDIQPGLARARMVIGERHLNGLDTVQGGAIFTLADLAFAAAVNSHGTASVAVNVSITFMKAAKSGTLHAEAREVSRNFKLATYTVDVRDDAGDLVAQFQGLAYRKKEKLSELGLTPS
jgi:acyl-CoA thioesterase